MARQKRVGPQLTIQAGKGKVVVSANPVTRTVRLEGAATFTVEQMQGLMEGVHWLTKGWEKDVPMPVVKRAKPGPKPGAARKRRARKSAAEAAPEIEQPSLYDA